MTSEKSRANRDELARTVARALCRGTVYTEDSAFSGAIAQALTKLPVWALENVKLVTELKNDALDEQRKPKRIAKADELLEDIGEQLRKLPEPPKGADPRLSCIGVRLYVDDLLLTEMDLGIAIEYLGGDVYFDENVNWSTANRAEVYVY